MLAGRGAEERERQQRNRLKVTSCRTAADDGDRNREDNQPERRQNHSMEMGRGGWHECREHNKPDAENRNDFARSWRNVHGSILRHYLSGLLT